MTKIYGCDICKYPFITKDSRNEHNDTVNCKRDKCIDIEPILFGCSYCDKTSFHMDNITEHEQICSRNPLVLAKKNLTMRENIKFELLYRKTQRNI